MYVQSNMTLWATLFISTGRLHALKGSNTRLKDQTSFDSKRVFSRHTSWCWSRDDNEILRVGICVVSKWL